MLPDDDEVWKGIVDHYGDRAELDPDDAPPPSAPGTASAGPAGSSGEPAQTWRVGPIEPASPPSTPTWDDPDADWSSDRFVPPPPPPLPATTRDRYLAWLGLFGSPVVLVLLLVLGVQIPGWILVLLLGAFVGGFGYLVFRMSGEPRDPGDDGAVL